MFLPVPVHVFAAPQTWFGPAEATFQVQFSGDQYDPAQNDVHVLFKAADGHKEDRLAYFDGFAWHAVLLSHTAGGFTPILVRNGKELPDIASDPPFVNVQDKLMPGFIHPDPEQSNRFLREDGSVYIPVGYNLAWQTPNSMSLVDQIKQMGSDGLTWCRIWAANWDKRNPWWPVDDPGASKDQMWLPALDNWDTLMKACDTAGLPYQITLFNHGSFSSTTDTDWPKHPWNVANGGFLKSAAEFFTDPEAKRRTKIWLRYVVARFSADPNLVAYELFNEVEWTDAAKAGNWSDIAAWHTEMAAYIQSLDPYNHMITTSSTLAHPEIWNALSYYQPHLYSADLPAKFSSVSKPKDKPLFFGEFGGPKAILGREELREALYASLFAATGGPAMYWSWDQVESAGYSKEFAALALAIKTADFGKDAVPVNFRVTDGHGAPCGRGVGRSDWALALVHISATGKIGLHGLVTADGPYTATLIDPNTAVATTQNVDVKGGATQVLADKNDVVLVLRRKA